MNTTMTHKVILDAAYMESIEITIAIITGILLLCFVITLGESVEHNDKHKNMIIKAIQTAIFVVRFALDIPVLIIEILKGKPYGFCIFHLVADALLVFLYIWLIIKISMSEEKGEEQQESEE